MIGFDPAQVSEVLGLDDDHPPLMLVEHRPGARVTSSPRIRVPAGNSNIAFKVSVPNDPRLFGVKFYMQAYGQLSQVNAANLITTRVWPTLQGLREPPAIRCRLLSSERAWACRKHGHKPNGSRSRR